MNYYDENLVSIELRKYHYWRGFRTAAILAILPIAALIYGLQIALAAMQ